MTERPVFPFTAIVGQELMKKGLVLNAINPKIGGVLIRGQKGTAKSTAVRAFANLLPELVAVEGCPYSCDPEGPILCQDCAAKQAAGQKLPTWRKRVPLVELPLGATEDRVVGTLNLERAIKEGERSFEPGLLAAANRGILYVDEVNLLGDHLVDVLLDAAALGQNYVEREGISVSHPAQLILVGTMNPEEGDLRPQLLDRFALCVEVVGLEDLGQRSEVVRRRIAFESDPWGFIARWQTDEDKERDRIIAAQQLLPSVVMGEAELDLITQICAAFQVDGLRGDLVMYKAALAIAAYAGRSKVTSQDVREAAELALPHRRRRQPFDRPETGSTHLQKLMRELTPDQKDSEGGESSQSSDVGGPEDRPKASLGGEQVFQPGETFPVRLLRPLHRQKAGTAPLGKRTETKGRAAIGYYVTARPPAGDWREVRDLALGATLRAAAPFQVARRQGKPNGPKLLIAPSDVREKVRQRKAGDLLLFVVDASGSMAARRRMAAVKGAVLSLLTDAYQKRDRVSLIVFRGEQAELLLPPTNSVDLAERQLKTLPTGGRTPLAHALSLSYELLERYSATAQGYLPWLICVTDGRPNVPLFGGEPFEEACLVGMRIRERGISALVIDTEAGPVRVGRNRELAEAMGADYLGLEDLAATAIARAVRQLARQ